MRDYQGLSWPEVKKILTVVIGLKHSIMADNAVYPFTDEMERPGLQDSALVKAGALHVILNAHPWAADAAEIRTGKGDDDA
jgi:hypothetical protein